MYWREIGLRVGMIGMMLIVGVVGWYVVVSLLGRLV
jgi:hypothetical protein